MNICDTDRYRTTLIFCKTMIIVYRCGKCFVVFLTSVLTSSTFKVVLCGVPWKSWAQRRWLQVSECLRSQLCFRRIWPPCRPAAVKNDEMMKTKTEFWTQKETWPQGSPRCTFSHRLWGGSHRSEWSRKSVSSMNPLGLQISEQFLNFKHFLSLSAFQKSKNMTLHMRTTTILSYQKTRRIHVWQNATRTSRPFRWSIVTSTWLLSRENSGWEPWSPTQSPQGESYVNISKIYVIYVPDPWP